MASPVTITATGGGSITINGGGGNDPPSGTKYVQAEAWGGGGGGKTSAPGTGVPSDGGHGGGYAKKVFRGLSNSDILYYNNAAGSAPGATANPTWVHKNTNTDASSEVRAAGGGQLTTTNGTPAGDLTNAGGNGGARGPDDVSGDTSGGGGGGAGGADATGGNGSAGIFGVSAGGNGGAGGGPSGGSGGAGGGAGANPGYGAQGSAPGTRGGGGGGGGGSSFFFGPTNGATGVVPGGGGGGSGPYGGTTGTGAAGQIIFSWFSAPYSHTFSTGITNYDASIYGFGWTKDIGNKVVVTSPGNMFANDAGICTAVLEGVTFGNDHKASATLKNLSSTRYCGVTVRHGSPTSGNYYGYWADGTTAEFFKSSAGTHTNLTLASGSLDGAMNNSVLEVEASGTSIIVRKDGVEICRATDSTYSSGSTGFVGKNGNGGAAYIQAFSASNAAVAYSLSAVVGTFALTGVAATLFKGRTLAASVGAFALTGIAAGTFNNQKTTAAVGTFALTGVAANLLNNQILPAAVGSFTFTGIAAVPAVSMPATTGTFALTGVAANLLNNQKITASVGTFALTGVDALLIRSHPPLVATVGAFTLSTAEVKIRKNHHQRRFNKLPDPWISLWWAQ